MNNNFKEKTKLGRTGLMVSRLGIAAGWGINAEAVEKAYYESGINYFFLGGRKREGINTAIRNLAPREREKLVVAIISWDHFGILTMRGVNKNLKKLNLDYADILVFGWCNKLPSKRIINKALKLKEEGKIKYIGMSGHNRKTFGKLAQDPDSPIDVFMVRYNAVHTGAEQDVFPYIPGGNRPGISIYTATCWGKLLKAKNMPDGEKAPSAADCYRFVLSNSKVDVCLTGPASADQLEQSLTALEKGPLSEVELTRIRKIGGYIY
jgi:aryl-alcohol dehydrogenase-like predicted oxidoreductase